MPRASMIPPSASTPPQQPLGRRRILSRTPQSARERTISGRVLLFTIVFHVLAIALAIPLLQFSFDSPEPPPPVAPPTNSEGETVQYFDIVPGGIEGLTAPPAAAEPTEELPGGPNEEEAEPGPRGEERARPPPGEVGDAAGSGGIGTGSGEAGQAGGAETGSGGAGAFRPGYRDSRLYVAPREIPPPPEPSEHERYVEHLQARIDAYNDSIGAEADRAERATDWTVRDKKGRRWGISPKGIHLGSITLGDTVAQSELGPRAREAAEERRQRAEIQRNEDTRAQSETMKERVRATRERKDAERRQARGESAPDSLR